MAVVGTSGFLMVCTWRFWSGKEITLAGRHPFQVFGLIAIFIYALVAFSQILLFVLWFAYMFSGIAARFAYSLQRRNRKLREQG
jgi:CDP-diacylglycerol--serine O-phosphatidyltransferase